MTLVASMKGVSEILEIMEDRITLTPKGLLGFMTKGMKGTKEIPFRSIVAVQFKEAGAVFSGYLQFTIAGGNESKGGLFAAASDENTFMFAEKKNNEEAKKMKGLIDAAVARSHAPQVVVPPPLASAGISEQIKNLADLHRQGVLSDAEFERAKQKLLS